MMDDLDQRIKKAENASLGPWKLVPGWLSDDCTQIADARGEVIIHEDGEMGGEVWSSDDDAEFIIAWNPKFAQEVGQRLKAAENKVKRVEELLTGSETISASALREALGG